LLKKNCSAQERAEAILLLGQWMLAAARFTSKAVIRQFQDAIQADPQSEDGYFALAKYLDDLHDQRGEKSDLSEDANRLSSIISNYGSSLHYGSKYIFQALPRLLTVWFDNTMTLFNQANQPASAAAAAGSGASSKMPRVKALGPVDYKAAEQTINAAMQAVLPRLAPYQTMTALPQLTSRIGHFSEQVFAILKAILLSLFDAYPQQTFWLTIVLEESSQKLRKNRYHSVIRDAGDSTAALKEKFTALATKLLKLCNLNVPQEKSHIDLLVSFK
jgi:serine/threonine-protein kinase ATR